MPVSENTHASFNHNTGPEGNALALTSHETERKHNSTFRQQLRDQQYRSKLLHSCYICLTYISLGMVVGLIGPTFLDLQLITGTDLEKASAFFTGGSIGYLTGSVIAGTVYNMVNKNFLMFAGTFSMSISTAVTPYCKNYGLMIFIRILSGISCGAKDTFGNSEQMRIWGAEGKVLMQLLHFAFALGGVISPLYTEPFLAKRESKSEMNNISTQVGGNWTNVTDTQPLETNVHYAFAITGIFALISSLPFLVMFIRDSSKKKTEEVQAEAAETQRKLPLPVYLMILGILCSFYMLYCCVEDTFASFLMTFLVRQYNSVSKSQGAYITSMYWGSFAVSRFLMIFVSKLLSPVQLLTLCCTIMVIAFSSFVISALYAAISALTVFAVLAALGLSAIFPAGFSWTETELVKVTGRVSSCIFASASMGTMINPLILGVLMEELNNMWFCYLLVGETFMVCIIFVVLLLFNRCYVNKHYGTMGVVIISTIDADVEESQLPLNTNIPDGRRNQMV